MKNKIIIYLLLLLLLVSLGYAAEYKKTVMDKIDCTGLMKVVVNNNPACKIRDCSLSVNIWTCDCSVIKTLEVYTNQETTCSLTIEYFVDKSKVVFPFTTTLGNPITPIPTTNNTQDKEDNGLTDVVDMGKLILTLAFIVIGLIVIIILVARYIIKLALDEEEEQRKRDERN